MTRTGKRLCLAALLCALLAAPSWASTPVDLANRSGETISVALHYLNTQDQWVTEGWWILKPGEVSRLDLNTENKYLYVYGEGDGDLVWDGRGEKDAISRWVVDGKFKVTGDKKPAGANPQEVIFFIREMEKKAFFVQFDK